jgi:hypothetical protein
MQIFANHDTGDCDSNRLERLQSTNTDENPGGTVRAEISIRVDVQLTGLA